MSSPPPANQYQDHNLSIERAHLLYQRGKLLEARRLLEEIRRSGPRDPEVESLLAQVIEKLNDGKKAEVNWSEWRYYLHLNTSWRRFLWGAAAAACIGCGVYGGVPSIAMGARNGFSTEITTKVQRSRRRYGSTSYVDWTRPIYVDVMYNAGFILIGTLMGWILIRVSKGAAQWEELDDTSSNDNWVSPYR
jgi:hypothetical protein